MSDKRSKQVCDTCRFFDPPYNDKGGTCRINPPGCKGFPQVYYTDWCSKHEEERRR